MVSLLRWERNATQSSFVTKELHVLILISQWIKRQKF